MMIMIILRTFSFRKEVYLRMQQFHFVAPSFKADDWSPMRWHESIWIWNQSHKFIEKLNGGVSWLDVANHVTDKF